MAEDTITIGDRVAWKNGDVVGVVRYMSGDGQKAYVKTADHKFKEVLIAHLSKVEEQDDGDDLQV